MTSSRVPAIYPDAKHYLSQLQVKLIIQGKYVPPPPSNERALRRGKRLEPVAVVDTAEELGLEVVGVDLVRHENGWSGDSADSGYFDPRTGELVAIVEAKTVALNQIDGWGVPRTDQVPERVLIQCMWHLIHHPSVDVCYVPVIMGGFDFAFDYYLVQRDDEALGILLDDAERWYHDYIIKDRDPPLDPVDSNPLQWRTPYDLRECGEMTPEILAWANEKLRWAKVVSEGAALEKLAAAQVRRLTMDFGSVRGDGISITHRQQADSIAIDHEAVVRDLLAAGTDPELVQQLIKKHSKKQKGGRRLTVSLLKQKQPKQAKEEAA